MQNAGLEEEQAGIKIIGRNTNNLRYADDTTLMVESEEELKSLLKKVKEKSEKAGLKLNIQKTKIMASNPNGIQPVNPKGDQYWIFIGKTDAEAETPILWPTDAKNWLIGKDPNAGKGWRWEEKGPTEDEMVGWHHQLNGHAFE